MRAHLSETRGLVGVLVSLLESNNLAAEVSCGDELRLHTGEETVVGRVESVEEQLPIVMVALDEIDASNSEETLVYWLFWERERAFGGGPRALLRGVSIPPDATSKIPFEDAVKKYGEVEQIERR